MQGTASSAGSVKNCTKSAKRRRRPLFRPFHLATSYDDKRDDNHLLLHHSAHTIRRERRKKGERNLSARKIAQHKTYVLRRAQFVCVIVESLYIIDVTCSLFLVRL